MWFSRDFWGRLGVQMSPDQLANFRAGAREALERVYWENIEAVEALVRGGLRRSEYFSTANLADLVQEIFAKAFSPRARAAYDGVRDYGPYLRQLARNTLIDWLRERGRELVGGIEPEALLDNREGDTSVEALLFPPEHVAVAQRFVGSLSAELKGVHERRFLAAESQEQAARALGISRQSVRTLERRLLDGLRRELRRADREERSPILSRPKQEGSLGR